MLFCTQADLIEYILETYLDKIEEINYGIIDRTINNVSAEITEAIHQGGYDIPETGDSATLKRICAVMTAWRCVGGITSLMDTEASSDNEWLLLQKLYNRSEKDLDKIRAGNLDPWPVRNDPDSGISISAPKPIFGPDTWETF